MPRRALLLLAVVALGPTEAGCSDRCHDVDCGAGGVYVSWRDGDVVPAEGYRLCIEDRCHRVRPEPLHDPETDRYVHAGEGRPQDPVAVRLEAVGGEGEIFATYAGSREATGRCCKAVSLRVGQPDRLVPAG